MAGTVNTLLRHGLVVVLLVAGLTARADTVILKSGVTHKGAVLSDSEEEVTILSDGIEWVFKKQDVNTIKRDKASADHEFALRKKRKALREADDRARAGNDLRPPVRTPSAPAAAKVVTAASVRSDSSRQVVVYGTSWCGYCRKARAYFRSRDVAFVDKDIEVDPGANQEMKSKCAASGVPVRGVPVIDVYGTMIAGFDVARIDAALANHR